MTILDPFCLKLTKQIHLCLIILHLHVNLLWNSLPTLTTNDGKIDPLKSNIVCCENRNRFLLAKIGKKLFCSEWSSAKLIFNICIHFFANKHGRISHHIRTSSNENQLHKLCWCNLPKWIESIFIPQASHRERGYKENDTVLDNYSIFDPSGIKKLFALRQGRQKSPFEKETNLSESIGPKKYFTTLVWLLS